MYHAAGMKTYVHGKNISAKTGKQDKYFRPDCTHTHRLLITMSCSYGTP